MSECESSANVCESQGGKASGAQACVPQSSCCPVEKSIEMWSGAFCRAMTEVQVEILKERIKKSWGAQMGKAGDAVIEAMGAQWQAMLTQAQAQLDLRENMKKIWMPGQK